MKFCIICSGSKGNCFYIESGESAILIDIGLSYKSLQENLTLIKRDISGIKAIFISHEHSDHTRGLRTFVNMAKKPVFINSKSRIFLDIDFNGHEELFPGKPVEL